MNEVNPQPQQPQYDDEIDLRQLMVTLVEGWRWIVGVPVLAVLLALAYVMIKTPTYETQFKAIPAPSSNFAGFNLVGGFSISPGQAYSQLGNSLSSFQNFESFYQSNKGEFKIDENAELSDVFAERFTVSGLDPSQNERLVMTVDYEYPEGERGSAIVNAYVESTAQKVWYRLRQQFHEYNRAQIASLETDLTLQKQSLRRAREERLFTLEQALTVARRLGIEKPTTPQQFGRQPAGTEVFYADISGDNSLPLYFMGYQALEADRDTLKQAIDEGLSNSAIRATQQKLSQHKRIAELLNDGSLIGIDQGAGQNHTERVVQVVEYAFEPADQSKPKTLLILALAVVLGGMLGIMMVFIAKLGSQVRQAMKEKA